MTSFNAQPGQLDNTGRALGDVVTNLRSELNRLRSEGEQVFGTSWQGSAAEGFKAGWQQWLRGATESFEALSSLAQLLGSAGESYTTADRDWAGQQEQGARW